MLNTACEELVRKKAALLAEMAEVECLEKEREKMEAKETAAQEAEEAARLAAEKAAKKAARKAEKQKAMELGRCSMKSMEMEFQGRSGTGSCFKSL